MRTADGYTVTPTRLRINKQGDDERPWMLDGYDATDMFETMDGTPSLPAFTEECWTFATFEEAREALPRFAELFDGVL